MKVGIFLAIVLGMFTWFCMEINPDYSSPVISYEVGDNYVSFKEKDSAQCIKLNTRIMHDSQGYDYSGGVFDTIEGRPVCGVKGVITTQDLKHYAVFFNRFDSELNTINEAIRRDDVSCNKVDRKMCNTGGMHNKTVFKLD